MPRSPFKLSAPHLLLLLSLLLPACSPSPSSLTPNPQPLTPLLTIDADIDTLAAALPDALAQMHWGTLKLVNDIADLYLTAVTEDDRTVHLQAQLDPDRRSTLQLRVGLTGDPTLEKQFFAELIKALETKKVTTPK